MSILGKAALAMWWDIASDIRPDFENWHAHEHLPERLSIPGFRRGTRWSDAAGGEGMFVLYELDDHDVLASPAYVARLDAPTPWSTRLMPHHRHMVRSQCRVLESHGGVVARHALTLRLSPGDGQQQRLQGYLGSLARALAATPGLTGAHLLKHQAPDMATTTEQKIRLGSDQVADWVFLVCAYDLRALERVRDRELAASELVGQGADADGLAGVYAVCCSTTPGDVL
jgi:hypothetical protein